MGRLKICLAGVLALTAISVQALTESAVPASRARYLADCAARLKAEGIATPNQASSCAAEFQTVTATLPLARTIVKLAQTPPAALQTLAGLKAALPGVNWKAEKQEKQTPPLADYGGAYSRDLSITASGKGKINRISWEWMQRSATFPYDLPHTLRHLGGKATPLACGAGGGNYGDERETVYRVEVPGSEPFLLSIGGRSAANGGEWGYWSVVIHPGAPVPTAADFIANAEADPDKTGTAWSTRCPD